MVCIGAPASAAVVVGVLVALGAEKVARGGAGKYAAERRVFAPFAPVGKRGIVKKADLAFGKSRKPGKNI